MDIQNALLRYKGYGKGLALIEREIVLEKGNFINAIIGPRRAGKTFLMLLYKNSIDLPESNKIFINGEDIDFEGLEAGDLDQIEKTIFALYSPDKGKDIYLFIDEVQNFPSWGRWLRTLFDEHLYKIVVSGSTSDLSTDRLPNELRGRALNTLVMPFSFNEYCAMFKIDYLSHMKLEDNGLLESGFRAYLEHGGYPLVLEAKTDGLKAIILREIYETVLQRDLIEKYGIRRTSIFKSFINSMLGSVCRVVSPSAIATWLSSQNMKISTQAALNYSTYAESIFLFFFVYPYSRKPRQRNTRPKLYLPDSGLISLFDNDIAKKLENQVFVELKKRRKNISYFNSGSYEVDFVIQNSKGIEQLIQVSYSINDPDAYRRETKSLINASERLGCSKLLIITFNEEKEIIIGGKKIEVVPAWKWMLFDDSRQ